MRWQIFLGISPNTQQLSHSSVMSRISLCMRVHAYNCACVRAVFNVCVCVCELRAYKSQSWCKCIRGRGTYPCQSHMWLNEQILCIEGETLTSVAAAHQKSPSRARGLWEALPKVRRVICSVCLSPSASPTRMSSRLVSPSLHTLSSSCPSFLASEEVTFINGEFMCMTAPKPELCLDHPWRLSVNSCNHQSAKYLPFRAHQPCTRWLGVIYRIKSISSSADLHWYWYGVISSWLRL